MQIGGAEAASDFVAQRDSGEEGLTVGADSLGERPGVRDGNDIGMDGTALVLRVVVQGSSVLAVVEGLATSTDAFAAGPQCAGASCTFRQDGLTGPLATRRI